MKWPKKRIVDMKVIHELVPASLIVRPRKQTALAAFDWPPEYLRRNACAIRVRDIINFHGPGLQELAVWMTYLGELRTHPPH